MISPTFYFDLAAHLHLENVGAGRRLLRWLGLPLKWPSATPPASQVLLLTAPLGNQGQRRTGSRYRRYATQIPRSEFMRLAWADPVKGEIDYTKLADTELAGGRPWARGGWRCWLEALHAQPSA